MDRKMMAASTSMLLLKLLEEEDLYGYQMIRRLEARSDNVFSLKEGTMYPVLHALEEEGAVESYEKTAENGRTRKYYHLTKKGQRTLGKKREEWKPTRKPCGLCWREVLPLPSETYDAVENFLRDVDDQISCKLGLDSVNEELRAHIEDKMELYQEYGLDGDEACRRAIRDMGAPDVVGLELNQSHRLRTAKPLLFVILALMLAGFAGELLRLGVSWNQGISGRWLIRYPMSSISNIISGDFGAVCDRALWISFPAEAYEGRVYRVDRGPGGGRRLLDSVRAVSGRAG